MDTETFRALTALKPHLSKVAKEQYVWHAVGHKDGRNGLQRCASKLSNSSLFHRFVSGLIMLNFVVMIIETDQIARENRQHEVIFMAEFFGWASLALFVFELFVRLIAHGKSFWRDPWDVLDFVVILIDVVCSFVSIVAGAIFPVSILRTLRLVKLAKVSKMARVFPELRLLLAALVGSLSAIFWGTILLLVISLLFSMIAVTVIHPLAMDVDYGDCERCPRAFSSVMSAALTFWQTIIAGDMWGTYTIPLLEKYPATIMFFLPLYLIIGMAVLHLILGVVVDVAMESKETLLNEDRKEMALTELGKKTQLLELCAQMDTDQCGMLSRNDLRDAFARPGAFRDCVLSLGISDEDFDVVWAVISTNNKNAVSYKEFVNNISQLKHSDSQFMLTYIKYYITVMQDKIKSILAKEEILLEKEELLVQGLDEEDAHLNRIESKEDQILRCESQILQGVGLSTNIRQQQVHEFWPSDESETSQARACNQQQPGAVQRTYTASWSAFQSLGLPRSLAAAAAPSPHAKTPGHSRMPNFAASFGERAPIIDNEVGVWFARICDAMAIFQDEIKDIIVNMEIELKAPALHKSSMDQATLNMNEQDADVLDVSSRKVHIGLTTL